MVTSNYILKILLVDFIMNLKKNQIYLFLKNQIYSNLIYVWLEIST